MRKDKQTEIHKLAKQMSEAISNEVERKYVMEEAKLEAVLRENGWVKAEEIFAEIESCKWSETQYGDRTLCFEINSEKYAELKKKYTEGGE